jgi:hypothetical protein
LTIAGCLKQIQDGTGLGKMRRAGFDLERYQGARSNKYVKDEFAVRGMKLESVSIWAARAGHLDVLQWLVRERGVDPKDASETDEERSTPLHHAVERERLDVVQWLCGPDVGMPLTSTLYKFPQPMELAKGYIFYWFLTRPDCYNSKMRVKYFFPTCQHPNGELLGYHPVFNFLNLTDVDIGDSGCRVLCSYLTTMINLRARTREYSEIDVEEIELMGNSRITERSLKELARVCRDLTTFRRLFVPLLHPRIYNIFVRELSGTESRRGRLQYRKKEREYYELRSGDACEEPLDETAPFTIGPFPTLLGIALQAVLDLLQASRSYPEFRDIHVLEGKLPTKLYDLLKSRYEPS